MGTPGHLSFELNKKVDRRPRPLQNNISLTNTKTKYNII